MSANGLLRVLDHRFTLVLKAGLVRVINHQPFRRYFRSHLRFAYVMAETIVHGYRNAGRIQGGNTAHITIVHSPSDQHGDLERFFLTLLDLVDKRPDCPYIDLFLLVNDTRSHADYVAATRLFGRHLNIHFVVDEQQLSALMKTTGGSVSSEKGVREAMPSLAYGRHLRLPAADRNAAREYLKSIDAGAMYCAVSIPSGAAGKELFNVIEKMTPHRNRWVFVVLSDIHDVLGAVPRSLRRPSRSGFDFSKRMCIAAEADVFIGAADVFGLTAVFSGKPVQLVEGEGLPCKADLAIDEESWSSDMSGGEFERRLRLLLEWADSRGG